MLDRFRHLAAAVAVAFTIALGASHPATAQTAVKQTQLTEKQVEAFIAAQKKVSAAKADAELESIAKEHGFASLDELDDVEANILVVMDGLDPQSKAFAEPPVQLKRRIDALASEKSMPEAERKEVLAELNEALKRAQPIRFGSNVDLVKKHYDRLRAALQ